MKYITFALMIVSTVIQAKEATWDGGGTEMRKSLLEK